MEGAGCVANKRAKSTTQCDASCNMSEFTTIVVCCGSHAHRRRNAETLGGRKEVRKEEAVGVGCTGPRKASLQQADFGRPVLFGVAALR